MEGRYPNGLLLAITNCTDTSKSDEFNYWYNHMHVPDVTGPGIFRHAIRFANSDPASPAGQYVATYETAWEEVEKAMPAHREAGARTRGDEDRGTPLIQPVTVGVFKRKGGEFNAAAKPSLGMLLVLSNCKDTHDEKEFNRWYEDVHIPDILDTGAYHTAYRYVSTDPEATKGKYLAIYETDNRDAAAAREKLNAVRADWTARDRLYGGIDVVASLTANRIWPMD